MLNPLRRDRRTRRQASFNLEALDDRLVLSAAAAGAVAGSAGVHEHRLEVQIAKHEAKLDRMEAKHEAKLAKQEAKISQLEAKAAGVTSVMITASGSASTANATTASASANATAASASASASSTTAAPAATTTSSSSRSPTSIAATTTSTSTGTATGSSTTSTSPLPANVSGALQSLYQEYENAGGGSSFTPSQPSDSQLEISGDSVGVSLKMNSTGDFSTFLSQLQSDGLQVTSSSATYGLVNGMLPIGDLGTIAQVASSVTATPPASLK